MRSVGRLSWRGAKLLGILAAATLLLTLVLALVGVLRTPVERPAPPAIVDDVTRLNPVAVGRVLAPTTTEEIVEAVRRHPGPIAIGGGRYSMGGQTATDGALHIDMRRFDRILALDTAAKTITVQAGARWRQIQERIDPANLSVKIMQTYANFTVGGSLSVNAHGRYVGLGPLVMSVRSIKVVLADGRLVEASRTTNPAIFHGAIGGYGGLGVITEATLDLADNVRVKRQDRSMPVTAYREWFARSVRDSGEAVFHNGDIYPDEFDVVHAVSYVRTDDPVTEPARLQPLDRSYRANRLAYWVISEWPLGKEIREHAIDPLLFRGEPVVWRNYEASYDVAELEPSSREGSTYVLQEYFVPVERFDEFVPRMGEILRRHDVNVVNVSIRHARADSGSLLAWARSEVFAFVLYYKQDTDSEARRQVGVWTRELVDAAVSLGGAYYLPYQPHATEEQFLRAYPRAPEFFALKRRLDPTNKFRNKLWDRYYLPRAAAALADVGSAARVRLDSTPGYRRDEGQTFLTHPEWFIVYSSEEYAAWLRDSLPTSFPYVASIGQYWAHHREARALTSRDYPFNAGYHVMLGVIGASYSVELALKALYENSVGRFSGWTADHELTEEDRFAHEVAADYGRFIHVRPWYEYDFGAKVGALWRDVPRRGTHPIREWERRAFLTLEYGIKAAYAGAIEAATRAAYAPQDERMQLVVTGWSDSLARAGSSIAVVGTLDEAHTLIATPRYDGFRDAMLALARSGSAVRITEIAGNDDILLTGVAPASWRGTDPRGQVVYAIPLAADATRKRVAIRVKVGELLALLRSLDDDGKLTVDHIYDY